MRGGLDRGLRAHGDERGRSREGSARGRTVDAFGAVLADLARIADLRARGRRCWCQDGDDAEQEKKRSSDDG